ncbi:hypothetical protein NC651_032159 [Populus alba x Populus x berolinensis]|nr:hypothetical protein NC651_032159 [Populus alba x Populus x berolinensis]
MLWEPENRLLGLENLPGDTGALPLETSGVEPDSIVVIFFSWFINGPHFVSKGRGLNGCSTGESKSESEEKSESSNGSSSIDSFTSLIARI